MGPIVTYIVYGAFLALCLIGGKFKFKKGTYYEEVASVEVMKSLKGLAAIGVILHHISQHDIFQNSHTMALFCHTGHLFVAIFFFCSGYGLIKSLDKKPNYLNGFVKNRICKGIVLPFYVNVLIYGLFFYFAGASLPTAQWICNAVGLTMMDVYAWFPIVMAIIYLAFYLVFKNVKNRNVAFGIMLAVILFLGAVFCINGHFAWWHGEENWWCDWKVKNEIWWREQKVLWFNGEWWVNSVIAFLVGLIVADKEATVKKFFSKLYYIKLIALLLVTFGAEFFFNFMSAKFGYWTEFAGNGPGIKEKFITYFSQLPHVIFFVLFIYVLLMKFHSVNPITKFFGKYSLHTYLMNYVAIAITEEFIDKQHFFNKYRYFIVAYVVGVIVLSVVLGLMEYYATEGIAKLLFRKKKEIKAAN